MKPKDLSDLSMLTFRLLLLETSTRFMKIRIFRCKVKLILLLLLLLLLLLPFLLFLFPNASVSILRQLQTSLFYDTGRQLITPNNNPAVFLMFFRHCVSMAFQEIVRLSPSFRSSLLELLYIFNWAICLSCIEKISFLMNFQ